MIYTWFGSIPDSRFNSVCLSFFNRSTIFNYHSITFGLKKQMSVVFYANLLNISPCNFTIIIYDMKLIWCQTSIKILIADDIINAFYTYIHILDVHTVIFYSYIQYLFTFYITNIPY